MARVERLVVAAGLVEHVDPAEVGPERAPVKAQVGEPLCCEVDQVERSHQITAHRSRLGADVDRACGEVGGTVQRRQFLEPHQRCRRSDRVVAEATTDLVERPGERAASGARADQVVIGEQVLSEREGGGVGHRGWVTRASRVSQTATSSMGPTTRWRSSISMTRV